MRTWFGSLCYRTLLIQPKNQQEKRIAAIIDIGRQPLLAGGNCELDEKQREANASIPEVLATLGVGDMGGDLIRPGPPPTPGCSSCARYYNKCWST